MNTAYTSLHLCILIIGNEVLSRSVHESNLDYVLLKSAAKGCVVDEVRIVSDSIDVIAAAVRDLSSSNRMLITSGGIGPTHDDVTVEAVAKAFSVPLCEDADMRSFLENRYRSDCTPAVLSMAQLPKGTEVIYDDSRHWPILRFHQCYILPGLPKAFQNRIDRIFDSIPSQPQWSTAELKTLRDESVFAAELTRLQQQFPEVEIGSYPQIRQTAGYAVKITLRSRNEAAVRTANAELQRLFRQNGWL